MQDLQKASGWQAAEGRVPRASETPGPGSSVAAIDAPQVGGATSAPEAPEV